MIKTLCSINECALFEERLNKTHNIAIYFPLRLIELQHLMLIKRIKSPVQMCLRNCPQQETEVLFCPNCKWLNKLKKLTLINTF